VVQLTRRPEQQERTATAGVRGRHAPLSAPIRVGIDVLLIGLGFWLAYWLRYELEVGGDVSRDMTIDGVFTPGDYRAFSKFLPVLAMLLAILPGIFAVRGLYRLPRWTSLLDEAMLIVSSALLGFSALIVVVFYYRTLYFSRLVRQFGGTYYALASYNAGENRVVRWKAERPGLDEDEFIDDIPFPETQNYVKRILGTAEDYRLLYGRDGGRPRAAEIRQ